LKVALAAKVAAVATTEEQLRQDRAARQEAEGQLQQERAALADARSALEREHAALKEARTSLKEREADVSKLDGDLIASASRTRTSNGPSRSRAPRSSACSRRSRPSAELSRWKRSRLKVSHHFISQFFDLPFGGPFPF
jgi:chromosome segregation ATPase